MNQRERMEAKSIAPGSDCLTTRAAKELLREASAILAAHDGIHRLHSAHACLVEIVRRAADEERLSPRESARVQFVIEIMRYSSRQGFAPPGCWKDAPAIA